MLYYVEVCHVVDENAEHVFSSDNMFLYHTYFMTKAKTKSGIVRAANKALGKRYGLPMPVVADVNDIMINIDQL